MAIEGFLLSTTINNLKSQLKAEMLRRDGNGSVSSYGSSDYDFIVVPAPGFIVQQEHYSKIRDPLAAVNASLVPDAGAVDRRLISAEWTQMEARLVVMQGESRTSADVNTCAALCTGMCVTTCSTTCRTGCYGSCTGTCDGGCKGGCGGVCSNSCSGGCEGGCSASCGGCGHTCTAYCANSCSVGCGPGTCSGSCSLSCGNACETGCSGNCIGYCRGGCSGSCGGCGTACGSGCSGACRSNASCSNCSGTMQSGG